LARRWGGTCWRWFWAFAAGAFAHVVAHGLLCFPDDFDNLMYHLPLIDHWLQRGSLCAPDGANWFLPANNELLGVWLAAPFSGDFLVGLNNVPAVVLWAAALFELCRQLGLPAAWAHPITLASLLVQSLWSRRSPSRTSRARSTNCAGVGLPSATGCVT
jgi:hypothetical protein